MHRIIRAASFAALALVSAGLSSVCAWAQTDEYWPARPLIDNRSFFSQRLLDLHNRERERIGQPALVWDAQLAQDAKAWANTLAARGDFEHSPAETRINEGENLWRGTAGAYTLEEMMGHFISERHDFRPGVFPAVARSGNWHEIGHYTQVIWPTTRAVGCAVTSRRGTDYLVCRFYPAGNVLGQSVP